MKMTYFAPWLSIAAVVATPIHAQWFDSLVNPEVVVTLVHPPSLGIKVKRIAFAPVSTVQADELVSACIADLSRTGQLDIIDRGNTEKVLKEQKFSNSGMVDSAYVVELGKMLGSGVMLFVKVYNQHVSHIPHSETTPGGKLKDGTPYPPVTTYISKTQVDYSASVQAVDLSSGKIYNQQHITVAPSLESISDKGVPAFPSDSEVRSLAINMALTSVRQMLLSWTETRKLLFYDDKDYGMKEAYKRLQLKDYPGALAKSQEALEKAKADPHAKEKYLGRTNYNAGMCHFILGDYDAAQPFLRAARETDPKHKHFLAAEAECSRAIGLRDEMSKVDIRSNQIEVSTTQAEPPSPASTQPVSTHSGPTSASTNPPTGVEERLRKLEDLKKKGLITPQEYKKRREEILKEI